MNLPVRGSKSPMECLRFIILFNLFHSGLFRISTDVDIASDADDITLYKACGNIDAAVKTLRTSTKRLFK